MTIEQRIKVLEAQIAIVDQNQTRIIANMQGLVNSATMHAKSALKMTKAIKDLQALDTIQNKPIPPKLHRKVCEE